MLGFAGFLTAPLELGKTYSYEGKVQFSNGKVVTRTLMVRAGLRAEFRFQKPTGDMECVVDPNNGTNTEGTTWSADGPLEHGGQSEAGESCKEGTTWSVDGHLE